MSNIVNLIKCLLLSMFATMLYVIVIVMLFLNVIYVWDMLNKWVTSIDLNDKK